jgi:hypothetical protein
MDYKMTKKEKQRKLWVEIFNATLPQEKWYDEEFGVEMSIAVGGIYDSEYMNFVYDNIKSNKIKSMLKLCNLNFE